MELGHQAPQPLFHSTCSAFTCSVKAALLAFAPTRTPLTPLVPVGHHLWTLGAPLLVHHHRILAVVHRHKVHLEHLHLLSRMQPTHDCRASWPSSWHETAHRRCFRIWA